MPTRQEADRAGRAESQQEWEKRGFSWLRSSNGRRQNPTGRLTESRRDFQPMEPGNNPHPEQGAKKACQPRRQLLKEARDSNQASVYSTPSASSRSLPASTDVCPEQWLGSQTHQWIPDQFVRTEDKGFRRAYLGSRVRGLGVQWWIWSYSSHSTMTVREKIQSMTLVRRWGRSDSDHHKGMGITAVGFYSGGQRSGSTPYTARGGGNLYPMSRVRVSGWKITTRKHEGWRRLWLNPPDGFLLRKGHGDQTSPGVGGMVKDEKLDHMLQVGGSC